MILPTVHGKKMRSGAHNINLTTGPQLHFIENHFIGILLVCTCINSQKKKDVLVFVLLALAT